MAQTIGIAMVCTPIPPLPPLLPLTTHSPTHRAARMGEGGGRMGRGWAERGGRTGGGGDPSNSLIFVCVYYFNAYNCIYIYVIIYDYIHICFYITLFLYLLIDVIFRFFPGF